MPRKISLKVTTAHSETGVLNGRRNAKQATVYTLVIKAVGFHCDETTHCSCNLDNLNTRYEDTYDPDNAQCFLTTIPAIEDLLDELSLGVVITAVHEDHGCQKEEIQDMVSSYLGCSVKVHRLNATQFIIFSSDKDKAVVAKEVLMDTKCFHLPSTKFYVDHWKPTDNSVVEELPVKISVTITEIPAHLCTPTVAGFLLSPYCAMEDEDGHYKTTATSESFKCSAWTNAPLHLPKRIMTALFVQASEQHIVGEQHGSKDLRITQLLIDATINHVISEITGTQLTTSLKDIQDSRTQ